MPIGETDRQELFQALEGAIGKRPTETMMSLLPPVGWADVATKHDLEQVKSELEIRMEAMESRINERIMRAALTIIIPTIFGAFALAFAAARLA
ncbi:MAG: hypothetical protein ACRDH6_03895 [Actinomycetota bacterium]